MLVTIDGLGPTRGNEVTKTAFILVLISLWRSNLDIDFLCCCAWFVIERSHACPVKMPTVGLGKAVSQLCR